MKEMIAALAFLALAACSTTRVAQHRAAAPPAVSAETSPAPTQISPPAPAVDRLPSEVEVVTPPCTCVPAEPKTKPKPKPKPVHKEAPPQPQTASAVAETPPSATIDAQVKPISASVMSILGKKVRGPNGEDLGRVVDVLADDSGRVRVAIIDFGGFLGVGDRRIAVDWPLLRFNPDGQEPFLILSVSRDKLKSAPEYKDTQRPQVLMVP
jgi:hypothetical protein